MKRHASDVVVMALIKDLCVADRVVHNAQRSKVVHNLVVSRPKEIACSVLAAGIPSQARVRSQGEAKYLGDESLGLTMIV